MPPEEVERLRSAVAEAPLVVIGEPSAGPECDDTFGLRYLADREVASRIDEMFYYQGRLDALEVPDDRLTPAHRHVAESLDDFESASAGRTVRPSASLIERIVQPRPWAVALPELDRLRAVDAGAWEDGDGRNLSAELVRLYEAWLERWPAHGEAVWVRTRVEELRSREP